VAIIDGKRWPGWEFFKMRGKKDWVAYNAETDMIYGLCAEIEEGADPMDARFHYCSPISQPVFIDGSTSHGRPERQFTVLSSWKKMPACWRAIFRRDLFYLADDGVSLPADQQPARVPDDAAYYATRTDA